MTNSSCHNIGIGRFNEFINWTTFCILSVRVWSQPLWQSINLLVGTVLPFDPLCRYAILGRRGACLNLTAWQESISWAIVEKFWTTSESLFPLLIWFMELHTLSSLSPFSLSPELYSSIIAVHRFWCSLNCFLISWPHSLNVTTCKHMTIQMSWLFHGW